MGSTGYHRPCVYVRARVYAGPWHGAQLGGPIPLTRSQHPSLAIIPLGGSLAKDLIKYCYTRNLIPLYVYSTPHLANPFPRRFFSPCRRVIRPPPIVQDAPRRNARDPSRHPLDLRENASRFPRQKAAVRR